jgi:hypothetical protein
MTVHILGCGPSGIYYEPTGDRCIGVNDADKWSVKFSDLLLINSPVQFTKARLDTIQSTQASRLIVLKSLVNQWQILNKPIEPIQPILFPGNHSIRSDQLYFTNNSPFVAMTYAVREGADKVVLWGVDFDGHKYLRFEDCVQDFTRYAQWCSKQDVRIMKGSSKSRLVLEIWKGN